MRLDKEYKFESKYIKTDGSLNKISIQNEFFFIRNIGVFYFSRMSKLEPIKFSLLTQFRKTPSYRLRKRSMSKHDYYRVCLKYGSLRKLLDSCNYEAAFWSIRRFLKNIGNDKHRNKYIRPILFWINVNLLVCSGHNTYNLGIRRLNPWFRELILYMIWLFSGSILYKFSCKLDFPSIEHLLKLQVPLKPRNEEEKDQIEKVANILRERQHQLLQTNLAVDIIDLICQY